MKLLTVVLLCFANYAPAQVRVSVLGDMLRGSIKKMIEYKYFDRGACQSIGQSPVSDTEENNVYLGCGERPRNYYFRKSAK